MESLLNNLGLDWKLLLSQAANFLIVLVVLRLTVYKPLLKLMRERRERIEGGLEKAKEADKRLAEMGELQKEKVREAEHKGLQIVKSAEERARAKEKQMLEEAAAKEAEMMKRAKEKADAQGTEAMRKVEAEAVTLVKRILVTSVQMKPEAVDEALIKKAAETVKHAQ